MIIKEVDRNKLYTDEFKVKELSKVSLVDYNTAVSDSKYYELSPTASSRILSIYNIGSRQFSKKLYTLDPDIWNKLLKKRLVDKDILNSESNYECIINNNKIINVSPKSESNPPIKLYIKIMNKVKSDIPDTYKFYESVLPDGSCVTTLVVNKDTKVGFIIRYYIEENWIDVRECYYNPDPHNVITPSLLVSQVANISSVLTNDIEVDLKYLVDLSEYMTDNYEAFTIRNSKTYLSIYELRTITKKLTDIKVKISNIIDPEFNEYIQEKLDGVVVSSILTDLFTKNLSTPDFVAKFESNYLVSGTTFTLVSWIDFLYLLERLVELGVITSDTLISYQQKVMDGDTHYNQVTGYTEF